MMAQAGARWLCGMMTSVIQPGKRKATGIRCRDRARHRNSGRSLIGQILIISQADGAVPVPDALRSAQGEFLQGLTVGAAFRGTRIRDCLHTRDSSQEAV